MVDFPHPETPMTISTAGTGDETRFAGWLSLDITSLLRRGCRAIRKPVQTSNRADQARRNRAIASLCARDDLSFSTSCHHEGDIAAAIESRIGQRDARFGH